MAVDRQTSPLERSNGEIKRRTNVAGVFPKDPAVRHLSTALVVEADNEWAGAERCNFSDESIAKLATRSNKEVRLAITAQHSQASRDNDRAGLNPSYTTSQDANISAKSPASATVSGGLRGRRPRWRSARADRVGQASPSAWSRS